MKNINTFFSRGNLRGEFRDYFMATVQQDPLSDYWTNAVGVQLDYSTPQWKGLSIGLGTSASIQTFSQDLYEIDPFSGKPAKWERELYDIRAESMDNNEMVRLDALYAEYSLKKFNMALGRLDISEGPLFLKRDGRMNAFVYGGVDIEYLINKSHQFRTQWIRSVSPRATDKWYSMDEAIGLFNNGIQPNGRKADYHETADSRGIGVLSYRGTIDSNWSFDLTSYYFDRIMWTNWFETAFRTKSLKFGLQYVYQSGLSPQTDLPYEKRYIQPKENAHVVDLKAGYEWKQLQLDLSYLHVFDSGRFLFPKELGRERFYVTSPRSWIDGLGDTDAWSLELKHETKQVESALRFTRLKGPGMNNTEFNKYAIPSYNQINLDITYSLSGALNGMYLRLLYITKWSGSDTELAVTDKYYRIDIHHFNFITNIKF